MTEKKDRMPRHVAIIMDGNGRWAKARGLKHIEGHKAGAEAVDRIIRASKEMGLEYLTLYAFSTENWKRPQEEVDALMGLLKVFIDEKLETIKKEGLRVKAVGRLWQLPDVTRESLFRAIKETENNTGGTMVLALNYGGRAEIVDAVKKVTEDVKNGKIDVSNIDESLFSKYLYDPTIPDPELLIRTSGEMRLSNFLLWQVSYSELYVTDVLWPDFDKNEFSKAVDSYMKRERRFGGRV